MEKPKTSPVLAIVGGGSLLGRELRDLLAHVPIQAHTKLIGADENEFGTLAEAGGEPLVMTSLDEENLSSAKVVLLAGSHASGRRALDIISKLSAPPAIVDLTYVLEDLPNARLRAPVVEPQEHEAAASRLNVVAHPAAIVLALFIERLHRKYPIRRSVAHVFEPASERGPRGIEELQQQSVNLLTFKTLPKTVFDEQLAFNMLPRYGSEAPESLDVVEHRIERHLATLLAMCSRAPLPSIRLIQAPVFHGHTLSIWVELDQNPGVEELEQALASALIDVRSSALDPPTNVGVAGQSGLTVGAISSDRNEPRAAWFWVASDNIRVSSENALAAARVLLERTGEPSSR